MSISGLTSLAELTDLGVSVWLDDLSRSRLASGSLQKLIEQMHVSGVTTNPTIFANAVSGSDAYTAQFRDLASRGLSADQAVRELMCIDVQDACGLLTSTFIDSDGYDGRVSIEVPPALAHDAAATVAAGIDLWQRIDRPNLLVKVPATIAGLEATTELLARGVSVNVTLIFSLQRYRETINAYWTGIERARNAGRQIGNIHSVASFFVSRVDTVIDAALRDANSDAARELCGRAAVANARLAYEIFRESLTSERAQYLRAAGANVQRPLWASTGVKDDALPDTLYVTELAGPNVVNTMPESTLHATAEHGQVHGDTLTKRAAEANQVLNDIAHLGFSYEEAVRNLEVEGIEKFVRSYDELVETASRAMRS